MCLSCTQLIKFMIIPLECLFANTSPSLSKRALLASTDLNMAAHMNSSIYLFWDYIILETHRNPPSTCSIRARLEPKDVPHTTASTPPHCIWLLQTSSASQSCCVPWQHTRLEQELNRIQILSILSFSSSSIKWRQQVGFFVVGKFQLDQLYKVVLQKPSNQDRKIGKPKTNHTSQTMYSVRVLCVCTITSERGTGGGAQEVTCVWLQLSLCSGYCTIHNTCTKIQSAKRKILHNNRVVWWYSLTTVHEIK